MAKNFLLGLFCFLGGIFFIQLMGIVIKFIGTNYPSIQLSFFRNLFGILPIIIFMFFSGEIKNYNFFPRIPLIWLAILRGGFLAFAQLCFFISLLFLNFATATTLQQTTPFVVALLSIPILGTKVGFWKVLALMIGFSGVLLIMKPGNDFLSYYAFLPLGASFGYGINLVLVKLYPKNVPTILIQYYTQLSATLITLAILFVSSKFIIISKYSDFYLIFLMSIFGVVGVYLINISYRMTNHINLGPFQYFGIIFSFALGWLFFNEAPFNELFPGFLLIILAGLVIFWRQRITQK